MSSQQVLAAIDQIEDALDDMSVTLKNQQPKNVSALSSNKPSSTGWKGVMSRLLRPKPNDTAPNPSTKSKTLLPSKSKDKDGRVKVLRSPPSSVKKRASFPTAPSARATHHLALKTTNKTTNAWERLFPKKAKKRAGDTTLLIPKDESNNDWFLPDDDDDEWNEDKTSVGENKTMGSTDTCVPGSSSRNSSHPSSQEKGPSKKKAFMSRLLRGRSSRRNDSKDNNHNDDATLPHPSNHDLHSQDRTRSLSLEDEELQLPPIFKSDEELIDHLVKICDKNSSLEEGFNCLQERLRSRSFSNLPVLGMSDNDQDNAHANNDGGKTPPVFSTSFLEMKPPTTTTRTSHRSSPARRDPHNDSIPSFTSLEEFLTSGPNDCSHSASLEALLFEQELEKLSTEELAELLDTELEKLMREGISV